MQCSASAVLIMTQCLCLSVSVTNRVLSSWLDRLSWFLAWRFCSTCHTSHTHTHPFNGPFSGTTQVSQYQKGKTNLDFTEARDSEWQWHQLEHMQVCISLQTANHASTPPLSFFTGRMPFLPPNCVKALKAYFVCHTSYHKEIRVSAKIRVLPSGIFS